MAWPPTIPPNTRQNTTPELDNHPSDHNTISNALTELVAKVSTIINPPRFQIVGGTAQPLTPSTATVVTFAGGTETFDTHNVIAPGNGRFTCPAAFPGRWRFDYSIYFAGGTGGRDAWIEYIPGGMRLGWFGVTLGTSSDIKLTGGCEWTVNAGDQVALICYSTVALNCNGWPSNYIQGRYLGPA